MIDCVLSTSLHFSNRAITKLKMNQETELKLALFFYHCVKSVQIRSFFSSVFSHIRTEYGDLLHGFTSIRILENTDQKKLRIWILFAQCIMGQKGPLSQDFIQLTLEYVNYNINIYCQIQQKIDKKRNFFGL